jgi:membrane protein implicated in regulation of membrane protease activity
MVEDADQSCGEMKSVILYIIAAANMIKPPMDKRQDKPSLRIVVKYFLLQLPGQAAFVLILLLVRQWVEIPLHLTWGLLGFWIGKDIVMFPFLWRFYDPERYPDRFQMRGRRGVALTRLNPAGLVRVRGEKWQAEISEGRAPIEPGEAICVEAVDGLKLTVASCTEQSPQ